MFHKVSPFITVYSGANETTTPVNTELFEATVSMGLVDNGPCTRTPGFTTIVEGTDLPIVPEFATIVTTAFNACLDTNPVYIPVINSGDVDFSLTTFTEIQQGWGLGAIDGDSVVLYAEDVQMITYDITILMAYDQTLQ